MEYLKKSARENFGKFIHQFQLETLTLFGKLERILIKLYRQNLSLLFNQICLNERLLPKSTEKDIDTRLTKAWTAIDRLSIIWKSDLTDKMKRSFLVGEFCSLLLY